MIIYLASAAPGSEERERMQSLFSNRLISYWHIVNNDFGMRLIFRRYCNASGSGTIHKYPKKGSTGIS